MLDMDSRLRVARAILQSPDRRATTRQGGWSELVGETHLANQVQALCADNIAAQGKEV